MVVQRKSEAWPKLDRRALQVCGSFEEADQADRAYWHAAPLRERMRALELTRQMVLGYGNGRALPRFQRVLEIIEPGKDKVSAHRRIRG